MQQTRDSVADIWGARTPCAGEWPARADERVVEQPDRWVQSACALCSNGCGMDIGVKDGRIVGVRGRATDIANRGRLGPKGLHGWEANNSPDRLTRPLIRRGDRLESASWDEAMELLVGRSRELLARHTGLSIGIYSTGQLFLEEYYTLALIARAGLRTPHADGNTRLCTAPTLVSTVLQGVYQSHQATAAAVQVNNLQLIRGLIGKPGAGVLQMNGQPTSQNTRETGAAEVLPGFRNFQNPRHITDLARVWNVDPESIPDRSTHAMQIFRQAEQGSIRMLWIIGTNPLVSLPELVRIRRIERHDLFVVVQDAFLTETAAAANLVLPTALWGEKTGTFTNAERTVHLSYKAADPPGEARADFDTLLDYARRMDFRDKDGAPLIAWCEPEAAFEAWKECSRGRPCDYTGLSYAKLSQGSGIRWPSNERDPDGAERLYADGIFNTSADMCESYGHDLVTGASVTAEQYMDPTGRAFLKPAEYQPPLEAPDEDYPLWLTTGRVVYHWHTRTKTGRARALRDAAPDAYVQIATEDAEHYGIADGDMVEITSLRGTVREPARVGDIAPGVVFIPFHYGYWDQPDRPRAANELTITGWDPVSKQPLYKYAAVRIRKAMAGTRVSEAIRDVVGTVKELVAREA